MLNRTSFMLLTLAIFSQACLPTKVKELKNYKLYVSTDDPAIKAEMQIIVRDYNSRAGVQALEIVGTEKESNSLIHFRKGLVNDGRKLGLGQWTAIQKEGQTGALGMNKVTTVEYGMDVVFDLDNFKAKTKLADNKSSDAYKHLFHLFSHEVGHGMKLDHDDSNKNSVMYPSITETGARDVDYSAYFATIRAYLNSTTPANTAIPMNLKGHLSLCQDHDHEEKH